MNVWTENYGADADGNRGILTTFAELEPEDDDLVVDEIYESFVEDRGDLPKTMDVYIDDFEFEIDTEDYRDQLVERLMEDEVIDLEDKFLTLYWLKENETDIYEKELDIVTNELISTMGNITEALIEEYL